MKSTTIAKGILKSVLVLILGALFLYFIFLIKSVIAYLVIAAVVALIGRHIVLFFRRKLRFPNTLAVSVSLLLMLGAVIGIIALLIPLLTEQGENLALLRVEDIQEELNNISTKLSEALGSQSQIVEDLVEEVDLEEEILGDLNVAAIPSFFASILEILSSISIGLFSVLFISFFFLKDSKLIQRLLLKIAPEEQQSNTLHSLSSIKDLLSRYFVGLVFQLAILFVFYSATLLLVGIENAMVIGFLCALFNIIPYVGPIIGGVIMLALTLTSNLELDFYSEILPKIGYVSIGIVIGQLVDNFFSQPYIFSNTVKSHPLEIFLIIIIAGLLFRIPGMIVAIPTYTVLKVILKEFTTGNRVVDYITKNM